MRHPNRMRAVQEALKGCSRPHLANERAISYEAPARTITTTLIPTYQMRFTVTGYVLVMALVNKPLEGRSNA